VIALGVAPDGSWLASTSGDETVRIWDPVIGTLRHTLIGHTNWVRTLGVARDGSWLASASDDKTVRIWDPVTGTARHTLTGHTDGVTALAVAPDGSWLASASFEEVRIWDPITGTALTSLRVAGRLFHLVVASTTMAVGGERGMYFLTLYLGLPSG
jgi:WD40 repeat protein